MGERKTGSTCSGPRLQGSSRRTGRGSINYYSSSGTDARSHIRAEKQEDSESTKVRCEITIFLLIGKTQSPLVWGYKPYICYYGRLEYDVLHLFVPCVFLFLSSALSRYVELLSVPLCSSHLLLSAGTYQVFYRMIVLFFSVWCHPASSRNSFAFVRF